ncbi:hypothetical protein J3458_002757 [Metarhizium acridum]|uniref:uncharacterized protein n=1 Tax=Metarhizium acridum TaxID=92637 RepID=UPI001C6CC63D|nr:hypothetical protein J3458_002757 [Metarhizium acridum]
MSKNTYNGEESALHTAGEGHHGMKKLWNVRILLTAGVDIEARGDDVDTPLLTAAFGGHTSIVRELVDKGANFEAKVGPGKRRTLPDFAAEKGREAIMEPRAEQPDSIGEDQDINGRTPLSLAASREHEVVVKLLVKHDAISEI